MDPDDQFIVYCKACGKVKQKVVILEDQPIIGDLILPSIMEGDFVVVLVDANNISHVLQQLASSVKFDLQRLIHQDYVMEKREVQLDMQVVEIHPRF